MIGWRPTRASRSRRRGQRATGNDMLDVPSQRRCFRPGKAAACLPDAGAIPRRIPRWKVGFEWLCSARSRGLICRGAPLKPRLL